MDDDRSQIGQGRRIAWSYMLGAVSLVAGVVVGSFLSAGSEAGGGSGGGSVENETWRWIWTGVALGMGLGEIFTAGFFLLPFAAGAAAAALLAWLGVAVLAQWLTFFGVSLLAFGYLRRFARAQNDALPAVGANRFADAQGRVLEAIDPELATGLVRVEGEEWRATTDGPPIPVGARVAIREVRGVRLVVESIDETYVDQTKGDTR